MWENQRKENDQDTDDHHRENSTTRHRWDQNTTTSTDYKAKDSMNHPASKESDSSMNRSKWDQRSENRSDRTSDEAHSSTKSSKRCWDQDSPQEPLRKKSEPEKVSTTWKNPGAIKLQLGQFSKSARSTGNSAPETKSSILKMGFVKPKLGPAPIKMSLGTQKTKETIPLLPKPKASITAVFNEDSDEEEEEMPAEARMRMKNVGRDTPTAAGPNSFGKSRLGFCDRQKMIMKDLEKQLADEGD